MTYQLDIVMPPQAEPVSVTTAKSFARITSSDDDTLMAELVKAATAVTERYLSRALITQTLSLSLDSFRDPNKYNDPYLLTASDPGIRLPRPPIQSITTVQYRDSDGTLQTFDAANYTLRNGELVLKAGKTWPTLGDEPGAVLITYDAGYDADGTLVPEGVKQAILRLVLHQYERADGDPLLDPATLALLAPFRVRV